LVAALWSIKLFGAFPSKNIVAPPTPGVAELIICVFDEKRKLHHHFRACDTGQSVSDAFHFLNEPEQAFDSYVLTEAIQSRKPTSVTLSYGDSQRKYLYVLPYERKWGKWRFACIQVTTATPDPDGAETSNICGMAEERVCLVLADAHNTIRSISSRIPDAFGYMAESLVGMNLADLFSVGDVEVLSACTADTNKAIQGCILNCVDGSKRDVEIKKFSMPDKYTLYGICNISPTYHIEEFAEVGARERRRIGQDLHDSIGQMLTGISLLSRSLANDLKLGGNRGNLDASQISGLADEASNQIRQISRGLMPTEIVENGLFSALQALAQLTTDTCEIQCEARMDKVVSFPDMAVETHLYRIAQEAVHNAVRHADASRIDIIISGAEGMQQLIVRDNGSWKEAADRIAGIGLKTMEYRALAIGAQLDVRIAESGGTVVACRLKYDESLATSV
jgi:signal transduction histidine kinase